jgi:hypothetical protein
MRAISSCSFGAGVLSGRNAVAVRDAGVRSDGQEDANDLLVDPLAEGASGMAWGL